MKDRDDSDSSFSRREFLGLAGAGVTILGLGALDGFTHMVFAADGTSQS
ncbi:MAG: twin-arginine translocation signal domain-containing protein, partial [Nitrospira sp.]